MLLSQIAQRGKSLTKDQETQIATIDRQLSELNEKINRTKAETDSNIEKRDKLNEQVRNQRIEIHELTFERDKLNEQVKTLKQKREEASTKIAQNIERIKLYRQRIAELRKKVPRESRKDLQEALESIEWRIQTTSLDLAEEKRLIETVKQLETQLSVHKKIEQRYQTINELEAELKGIETKRDSLHQELTNLASKSQELHAKILVKTKDLRNAKVEADTFHGAYVQAREMSRPLREEIKLLMERRKTLEHDLKEEREREKKAKVQGLKEKEQELKEKLESQAREKLERGEKLNWQEFQLLGGDDQETGSKAQD
jgi:uncharacterized coiled-coil DUF342 family protein